MDLKKALRGLWPHKWWILGFCVLIFLFVDHSVIHSSECYSSPCTDYDYLEVSGMSFLAPTGIYSAHLLMPMNYVDRYIEGFNFRGGPFYKATTHLVVQDDLDPTEEPFVTDDLKKSFLTSSFLTHKLRVLLSFPLWIGLYWLLFIRLRKLIKRNAFYYPIMIFMAIVFLIFGLLLKLEIDGGKDVTWQYVSGLF